MKLYVLLQEVFAFDRRISATVLGKDDNYDREVTISYPAVIEEPPCAENNWESKFISTFDVHQLTQVLRDSMSYRGAALEQSIGRYVLYPHRDVTLSGEAHHMPDIGAVTVRTRTIEIDIGD